MRRELRKRKGHKKQEDNNAQSVTRQDAHRNKSGDRGASTQAVKVSGGADVVVISRTCASDEEHPIMLRHSAISLQQNTTSLLDHFILRLHS